MNPLRAKEATQLPLNTKFPDRAHSEPKDSEPKVQLSLSEEQAYVIQHIKNGENAIVNAVAGSGKSTTVLSIATFTKSLKTIQFTYNSMLRHEIKEKTEALGIKNLDVHTYHSMAVKYYYSSAYTDTGIRYILANKVAPRIHIPKKDIIVIDEAQDMTPLYFQLVVKFTMDMNHPFQLVVLGDFMQGLYEFKGADTRFLTLAHKIWEHHPNLKSKTFHLCSLNTSYRITNQMSVFINDVLIGSDTIKTCREGALKVHYLRNNRRNLENTVIYHIRKLIAAGAQPSDFFVLGASVKGPNSQIRKMENVLVSHGIPCHVPMFETDTVDEKVIQKKVVFCTFHSVKGRQRKYVFVLGFDQGYMRFYGKDLPQDKCPSTIYVACTRATEGLYILERNEFESDKPPCFLKKTQFEMRKMEQIDFIGAPYYPVFDVKEPETQETRIHNITPTELIKFIPESVLEEITPYLATMFKVVQAPGLELDIPSTVITEQGFCEEVSDLNGLAIPALYYDYLEQCFKEPLIQVLEPLTPEPSAQKPLLSQAPSDPATLSHMPLANAPSQAYEATALPLNPKSPLKNVLQQEIDEALSKLNHNEHAYLKTIASKLPETPITPADYLFLANVYSACQEKLYFKLAQITDYNWINEEQMQRAKKRLEKTIGKQSTKPSIETTIIHQSQETAHEPIDAKLAEYFNSVKFRFTARTDLITDNTVWEIKCTKEITMDHQLQVVIYAWLYRMLDSNKDNKTFKLYNIKTGEIQQLDATDEELDYIVISLLQGKYEKNQKVDDDEFVSTCTRSLANHATIPSCMDLNADSAVSINTGCL
jgi:hypothetical protein